MSEQKIGLFIRQLRMEKKYTQKELAELLNITDKAVSKWERGLSCPDILLITPLAEILGCSVSELLNGERTVELQSEKIEETVDRALKYSDGNARKKLERVKGITAIVLSASCLLAAIICFICDVCTTGKLSWSWIVLLSLALGWITVMPLLKAKSKRIRSSLLAASLAVFPYLWLLGTLLNESLVYTLGSMAAIISLIGLWCIYLIFCKMPNRRWSAAGITLLISIPVSLGINHMVSYFIQEPSVRLREDIVNSMSLILAAAVCFGIDYVIAKKNWSQNEQ